MKLTQDRLKEILEYNEITGIFTKKERIDDRGRKRGGFDVGCKSTINGRYYYVTGVLGTQYLVHRLVWLYVFGEMPVGQIDHIDGDGENNAISNLREVDRHGNNQNIRKAQSNNKSGLLGVFFHKGTGKFRASIMTNGVAIHLGLFSTPEEAHDAYINAKRKYHSTCSI